MKKIILLLSCILIFTGCGKDEKNNKNSVKEVNKVESKLNSNTRPYAVMINNLREARPHAGLNDAYIVYEMPVEYGITRMMALFKDVNPEKIGSVRSSRPYYLDYVLENDAIYAHFGGSDQAYRDISSLKINNIDGNTSESSYFFRDKNLGRALEHTAFTTNENIQKAIRDKSYRKTTKESLLKYSVKKVNYKDSSIANSVTVNFSSYQTTYFNYDKDNKNYIRSMNVTGDTIDLVNKEVNRAKNIIVYGIPMEYKEHGYNYISNLGSGKGFYISEGKQTSITWQKDKRDSKTIYKTSNGEELKVNDGNTYILIYPSNMGWLEIK